MQNHRGRTKQFNKATKGKNPSKTNRSNKITKGFSLLELMVSIGILSIVTVAGVPSFSNLVDRNRSSSQAQSVHQTLALARTHAIAGARDVVVCPALNPQKNECRPKTKRNVNWAHGWLVFSDNNRNGQYDPHETLIRSFDINPNQAVVFNQVGKLRFFANGSARSAGFYICSRDGDAQYYVRLLYTGRARINRQLNPRQQQICKASFTA